MLAISIWTCALIFISGGIFIISSISRINKAALYFPKNDEEGERLSLLKDRLSKAELSLKAAHEELDQEKDLVREILIFFDRKEARIEELRSRLEELADALAQSEKRRCGMEEVIAIARADLSSLKEASERIAREARRPLERELEIVSKEHDILLEEKSRLDEMIRLHQDREAALLNEANEIKQRLFAEERSKDDIRVSKENEIEALKQRSESLAADNARKESLYLQEIGEMKVRIQGMMADSRSAKLELERSQDGSLTYKRAAEERLHEMLEDRKALEEKIHYLSSVLSDQQRNSKEAEERIRAYSGDLDAARQEIARISGEYAEINKASCERIAKQSDQIRTIQEEKAAEGKDRDRLSGEIDGLRDRLRAAVDDAASARNETEKLASALRAERRILEEERAKLLEEKRALEARCEDLARELRDVRGSIPDKIGQAKSVLQRVADTLREEREQLLFDKRQLDDSLSSARRESDSLKEMITDQKKRLAEIASVLREKESFAQDMALLLKDREYVLSEVRKDMDALRDQLSKREIEQRRTEGLVSALRDELGSVYDSIPLRISTAAQTLQKELEVMRKEKRELLEEKSELEKQLNLSRHENLLVRTTLKDIDHERAALKKLLAEYKEFENLTTGKIEEQKI